MSKRISVTLVGAIAVALLIGSLVTIAARENADHSSLVTGKGISDVTRTATSVTGIKSSAMSASGQTSAPGQIFPDSSNTGVPEKTHLSVYTGDCSITRAGTVIEDKLIDCPLVIVAARVRVVNSKIQGRVVSNLAQASVTIVDSEIDGGAQETFPSVSFQNVTLIRVNVVGGQHSVQCSSNCLIKDSFLHDQYIEYGSAGHVNAFISNGGSDLRLIHNTLHCTVQPTSVGGGCTADASLFGDFSPISHVTIDGNLFKANSTGAGYCLQAGLSPTKEYPNPTDVTIRNNVFERGPNGKCGIYGPATGFNAEDPSNNWINNSWQDGAPLAK